MFVEIIVVFFVDSLFFVCNFLIEYVFSVVEEFGRFSECVGMEFGCVFCLGFWYGCERMFVYLLGRYLIGFLYVLDVGLIRDKGNSGFVFKEFSW